MEPWDEIISLYKETFSADIKRFAERAQQKGNTTSAELSFEIVSNLRYNTVTQHLRQMHEIDPTAFSLEAKIQTVDRYRIDAIKEYFGTTPTPETDIPDGCQHHDAIRTILGIKPDNQ